MFFNKNTEAVWVKQPEALQINQTKRALFEAKRQAELDLVHAIDQAPNADDRVERAAARVEQRVERARERERERVALALRRRHRAPHGQRGRGHRVGFGDVGVVASALARRWSGRGASRFAVPALVVACGIVGLGPPPLGFRVGLGCQRQRRVVGPHLERGAVCRACAVWAAARF